MAAADKKTTYTAAEVAVLESTIQAQQSQIHAQQAQIDELKRKLEHMNEVEYSALPEPGVRRVRATVPVPQSQCSGQ